MDVEGIDVEEGVTEDNVVCSDVDVVVDDDEEEENVADIEDAEGDTYLLFSISMFCFWRYKIL